MVKLVVSMIVILLLLAASLTLNATLHKKRDVSRETEIIDSGKILENPSQQ